MHHPYPPPTVSNPILLIPPVAGGQMEGDPEGLMGTPGEQQTKPRVLLVEDEFFVSKVLARDLRQAGYEVVGPYATVADAMSAVQSQTFDGAILDINLKGQLVYPVAEELVRRQMPFMFLTGYADINMPEQFRVYQRLAKPANRTVLLGEIKTMLSRRN
jgi:DNA-binding response OmpR family regulator